MTLTVNTSGDCVTMEMTCLPQCCLTWWVASPVRWDAEEGVDNGRPSLEEGGDHIQPLWAQQLKQLEGESGRGEVKISSQKYSHLQQQQTYHHTHIQTCIHILWLTSPPNTLLLPRLSTW